MTYDFLKEATSEREREFLMEFLSLPPQKILLFASAIIASYIATFSTEESKDMLLKTIIDSITTAVKKGTVLVKCSFCEEDFYTIPENIKDKTPLCPKCVFPELEKTLKRK